MSLSIGAHVYKKLSDSNRVGKIGFNDKIYAYIQSKTETSFPFVIYKRQLLNAGIYER